MAELEVTLEDRSGARHAHLVRAHSTGETVATRLLYEVIAIEPSQDEAPLWVFDSIDASFDIAWHGARVEHPDRAILDGLVRALQARPPDVENVLASLPRLIRYESRGEILARAAALPALLEGQLDALLEHATGKGLDALTTSGRAPQGDAALARRRLEQTLARRSDLGPERAESLARATELLPRSPWRADVLNLLFPRLSTERLLAVTATLDPDDHNAALVRLVKERGHRREDALLVARALETLPRATSRSRLLEPLVPALTTGECLRLAALLDPSDRHALVARLVRDRGQQADDAERLADAATTFTSSSWKANVWNDLAPLLATSRLVELSAQLEQHDSHFLLARLARERGDRAEDAELIAAASAGLAHSSWRLRTLKLLLERGGVSTATLLLQAGKLDPEDHRALLVALGRARDDAK